MNPLRRRWIVTVAASIGVPVALVVGFGHRGDHAARSLLIPGAGLYDHEHLAIGLGVTVAFVAATVAWVRFGVDWVVAGVVVGACIASALATSPHHAADTAVARAAHEFPLVVLVVGAISWIRLAAARLGPRSPSRSAGGLTAMASLRPVERCQTVTIARLAGLAGWDRILLEAVEAPDVRRRARRVGGFARGRFGGDPFRIDHAHARTALVLTGRLRDPDATQLAADARRCLVGVPCSEPGWVRLLDGTLAAAALRRFGDEETGDRWRDALGTRFGLRRSHRPAALWTPLGLAMTHAAPWEHAAALGVAHAAGWCGEQDWWTLRRSALGAASRGATRPADERLVAAARVWVALVDDEQARRILARPTLGRDPLATALDALATRLRDDPSWLRAAGTSNDPRRSPSPDARPILIPSTALEEPR